MGLIRDVLGHYEISGTAGDAEVLQAAEEILMQRLVRGPAIGSPTEMTNFLRMRIGHLPHEEMHAVWLDTRHRVLFVEKLASGTIDGASVHCREVVKSALRANAAACVLAHCHPSGSPEPSNADRLITKELQNALKLVEVRMLDHIVVTAGECVSFASRGLI
jgi:DNA repair protein RadC